MEVGWGMELHDAPGSTLMCRGLMPWLVIMCRVVLKEVCPSMAVSVIKLVSMLDMGLTVVKWLTSCGGMFVVISWLRHVFISLECLVISLGLLVVLASKVCTLAVVPVAVQS